MERLLVHYVNKQTLPKQNGRSLGLPLEGPLWSPPASLKSGLSWPHQDLPSTWISHGRDSVRGLTPAHHINKQTRTSGVAGLPSH